jgi:hypothetical protein
METGMADIDFVVTWVDGGDPEWRERKRAAAAAEGGKASSDAVANGDGRYRDLGLLRYWFRGVERFAPWVRKVFFVTCGQKPDWLDESHPKLRLLDHRDYIPGEWLPTFHSNTIELNLHRVPELSERFVLFNDDTFLLRPRDPGDFFRRGLPVLPCDLGVPRWLGNNQIARVVMNNAGALKYGLPVERLVWKHIGRYVDPMALGVARAAKNLASFAVNRVWIPGCFGHLPQPHCKSTLETVWKVQAKAMERTCRNRFRADDCVNHWLLSAWDMASGRFQPVHEKRLGCHWTLDKGNLGALCGAIRRQKWPELCLNDRDVSDEDFAPCRAALEAAFNEILPTKSVFEK